MRFIFVALILAVAAVADNSCSDADIAKGIKNKDAVKPIIQKCAMSCITASDISSCSAQCFSKATGVSSQCSVCFGNEVKCTKDNCLFQCINPSSDSCLQCSLDKCVGPFDQCAGFESVSYLMSASIGDACNNADDISKGVSQKDKIKSVVQKCAQSCITSSDISSCSAKCMETSAGVSAPCASCFGDDVQCTKDNCLVQCIRPSSQSCLDCSIQKCAPTFDACSGLQSLKAGVLANGCDAADNTKISGNKAQIQGDLTQCSSQCFFNNNFDSCVADCMGSKSGLTATCCSCFGDLALCTKDNCFSQCQSDPSSAACTSCSQTYCNGAFKTCSGLSLAGRTF